MKVIREINDFMEHQRGGFEKQAVDPG